MNFKEIHIGKLIQLIVNERKCNLSRICKFLNCEEREIEQMYSLSTLEADLLLKWSKLLEYDLFRVYSQHLILYAHVSLKLDKSLSGQATSASPQFRKNIYTREVIDFILDLVKNNEMTKKEIIHRYNIPKTTLYKWVKKYGI
ncbi:transposase [Chryseobacterium sp.]|uniref:transposase n=1 Tax=Chryseobacterium sp. TaxID=1871047 RepID=UPI001B2C032D|nr:transposase [Chryseobacterium sp.]MBO9692934.1 transposase [Chryseobacterium sp.]